MDNGKATKARSVISNCYDKQAGIFWTGGKDSTLMLYLIRSLYPKMENPVIFLNSGREFPEVIEFINRLHKDWGLDLYEFQYGAPTARKARENKIGALKYAIKELGLKKIFVGIRRDEAKSRSKEEFVSVRKNHTRIHPLLDMSIDDVWDYIRKYDIPYCKLYDQGYKSLGEKPFTKPTKGDERSGRDAEKERIMNVLRDMGYF